MNTDDYKINVFHTHIEINRYELGDAPNLEKLLSVWNDSTFTLEPTGYHYDEEKKRLYIPRGCDIGILERMFGYSANIIYNPDSYDEISMRIIKTPKDDIQRLAISFLLGEGEFTYTKRFSQLLLNLGTGRGKTYSTAAAMSFFRLKTMVITHTNKIKSQWYDTFIDMTDLDETHICCINNGMDIKRLLKKGNPKYKVYLVNHGTLSSYGKTNGWEAVRELFIYLRIGLKVIDEAHLFFANMLKIDMFSNCKKSIYLTATFERSNRYEKNLFKVAMNNVTRYGAELNELSRKHIMYLALAYNSKPPLDMQAYMYTMRKFNKYRYAQYLSTSKKFYEVLEYIINFVKDKEGKILILSSTTEMCDCIKTFIEKKYPEKSVSLYHSKVDKELKERALDADIICSTPQSNGTGSDIRGLRSVINTEAYSSTVTADQTAGRLREYSPTDNTFYIELIDKGFNAVYEMYKRRASTIKKKCLKTLYVDYEKEGK